MYLFARARLYLQADTRDIIPAAFLPRRKHASTFMYSICPRETLWVIPNGRIVSASRGYCPIRDSPSARQSNGLQLGFIEGYTRPFRRYVFVVHRFNVQDLSVVPPLKWTSAIVSENFYHGVFLTPEKVLACWASFENCLLTRWFYGKKNCLCR